jgi:hypothetical protein
MIPRTVALAFWLLDKEDSNEMPCESRSLPWPGVSLSRYRIGFLVVSVSEGSLTERKRFVPVEMVGGRFMETKEDIWDVCVGREGFDRDVDRRSSCSVHISFLRLNN